MDEGDRKCAQEFGRMMRELVDLRREADWREARRRIERLPAEQGKCRPADVPPHRLGFGAMND